MFFSTSQFLQQQTIDIKQSAGPKKEKPMRRKIKIFRNKNKNNKTNHLYLFFTN